MRRSAIALVLLVVLATAALAFSIDRAIGAYTFRRNTAEGLETGFIELRNDHTFVLVVHVDRDRDGVTDRYEVTRGTYDVRRNDRGEPGVFVMPEGREGRFLEDPQDEGPRLRSFCAFERCFLRKAGDAAYFDERGTQGDTPLAFGKLNLITEPAGAIVFVDGKRVPGNTPLVVEQVEAGVPHTVRIERQDFLPLVRTVTVQPNRELRLEVPLPTGKEKVRLRSIPTVQVFVNGDRAGRTPTDRLELAPGSYEITLRNDGAGILKTVPLEVEEGKPIDRLFKFFGRLTVDVETPCRVLVGDVDLGEAPLAGAEVPAGVHRVRLVPSAGKPVVLSVRIVVDQETRVTGTLKNPQVAAPEEAPSP